MITASSCDPFTALATPQLYLEPLKNEPQVISREEHRVLFSNLNTIHLMHVTLLDELRRAAAASTSAEDDDDGIDACNDTIGATFVRHSAYLKMYSVYVNNFDSAMVELARLLAKRKKFRGFCQVEGRWRMHVFGAH